MTRTPLILIAMLGSLALLAGAFGFQYLGGMPPCHLCLLQRWPHAAAIAIGLVAVSSSRGRAELAAAGALTVLIGAGIAFYHTGVERHWWLGPQTCTGGDISTVSADDLLSSILAAPIVQCDQVAWSMAGLSMASWNGLASLVLAAIWIAAIRRD